MTKGFLLCWASYTIQNQYSVLYFKLFLNKKKGYNFLFVLLNCPCSAMIVQFAWVHNSNAFHMCADQICESNITQTCTETLCTLRGMKMAASRRRIGTDRRHAEGKEKDNGGGEQRVILGQSLGMVSVSLYHQANYSVPVIFSFLKRKGIYLCIKKSTVVLVSTQTHKRVLVDQQSGFLFLPVPCGYWKLLLF